MPINVSGNSSNISENKIDTSSFVQERYLRTNYNESNLEEDFDLKNHLRKKNYLIQYLYEKQLQIFMLITNLTILV